MKKILIVAPNFPPSSLPPSQRIRLMVKHLASLGLYPIVITTKSKYREELEDEWMNQLVGNNFSKIEIKALNQKITRKFGIGDLGIRMLPFLFPTILKTCRAERPEFILYPVPPWYILAITPLIKNKTRIPYGIDFIDPWVEEDLPKGAAWKKKISQKIAKYFERKAVENSSIIYSVSDGINNNLLKRYKIPHDNLFAIPYGTEPDDFKINIPKKGETDVILFRYIGVVWEDAYLVLDGLFQAINQISNQQKISFEFIGTSYYGETPQLNRWIEKYQLFGKVTEKPKRVSYRNAVELTLNADILLLFGGMQPYYAASKLMGLVASGKPFFAFVHKDSFPAKFLHSIGYQYFVGYSETEGNLPTDNTALVIEKITLLISGLKTYIPCDINNPLIQENTALGMTKKFIEPIKKFVNE
jgi:glycosyltransferase involved in cell wall biosynthesis